MKRQSTPAEQAVNAVVRRVAPLIFAMGAGVGALAALVFNREFIALHCTLSMALGVVGGILMANPALRFDPNSAKKTGPLGGMWAALGFALPFALLALASFITLNDKTAAQLLTAMTPDQIAQARQMAIDPAANPIEYFRGQYVSYIFGYPLVGSLVGWLSGLVGGALAKRRNG